jgi:hypothetical protein
VPINRKFATKMQHVADKSVLPQSLTIVDTSFLEKHLETP